MKFCCSVCSMESSKKYI